MRSTILALKHPARKSYRAQDVIEVLEEFIDEYGAPSSIRSDNGPEFIAYQIQDWLKSHGIKSHNTI